MIIRATSTLASMTQNTRWKKWKKIPTRYVRVLLLGLKAGGEVVPLRGHCQITADFMVLTALLRKTSSIKHNNKSNFKWNCHYTMDGRKKSRDCVWVVLVLTSLPKLFLYTLILSAQSNYTASFDST